MPVGGRELHATLAGGHPPPLSSWAFPGSQKGSEERACGPATGLDARHEKVSWAGGQGGLLPRRWGAAGLGRGGGWARRAQGGLPQET